MTTTADGRVIHVEQAEVRTATITVRALTIDRRQVTLAVFRQLQEEPLVDVDGGTFRGLPWGRVNYCPDRRACSSSRHLHVVWQKGDELRRATERDPNMRLGVVLEEMDLAETWMVLALDAGDLAYGRVRVLPVDREGNHEVLVYGATPGLPPLRCQPPERTWRNLRSDQGAGGDWIREYIGATAALMRELGWDLTSLTGTVRDAYYREVQLARRMGERYAELLALPQLFIAT
jgi:hypothetical protein